MTKPLTPEMAERLAILDKFCEGMDEETQFGLLELANRYTDGEITFEEFEREYWQSRSAGERLEETWRLSLPVAETFGGNGGSHDNDLFDNTLRRKE